MGDSARKPPDGLELLGVPRPVLGLGKRRLGLPARPDVADRDLARDDTRDLDVARDDLDGNQRPVGVDEVDLHHGRLARAEAVDQALLLALCGELEHRGADDLVDVPSDHLGQPPLDTRDDAAGMGRERVPGGLDERAAQRLAVAELLGDLDRLGDVEQEALDERQLVVRVPNRDRLVANPDRATVAVAQPIRDPDRLVRLAETCVGALDELEVARVDLGEVRLVPHPLLRREAGEILDLRVDVDGRQTGRAMGEVRRER